MKCSLLTLSCYVDGELDARRTGEMEAHLVGCPRCRAGLGHLRSEAERISALAAVRVPDDSACRLLEMLGLLGPDEALPAGPLGAGERRDELPAATTSLPWAAPPRLPRTASPPVAAPPRPAPEVSVAPWPGDLERALQPWSPPPPPGTTSAGAVLAETARAAPGAGGETSGVPPEAAPPGGGAAPPLQTPEWPDAAPPAAAGTVAQRVEEAPPPGEPPPLAGASVAEPSDASPPVAAPVHAEVPPDPRLPVSGVPALLDPGRRDRLVAALSGSVDHGLMVPHIEMTAHPAWPERPAPSDLAPPPPLRPSPPPGETPVPLHLDERDRSLDDHADVLAELALDEDDEVPVATEAHDTVSGAEVSSGPVPAPRPSLIDRMRERLAMRRALAGEVDTELESSIEVVSGTGAPLRSSSARAELARRRGEVLRPTGATPVAPPARREPGLHDLLPPSAHPSIAARGMPVEPRSGTAVPTPFAAATTSEPVSRSLDGADDVVRAVSEGQLAARTWGRGAPPRDPVHEPGFGREAQAPRRASDLADDAGAARPARLRSWPDLAPQPPAPARRAQTPAPASPRRSAGDLGEGRRLLAIYLGAVAVLLAVGLLSARTATPLPTATTGASTAPTPAASAVSIAPAGVTAPSPAVAPASASAPAAAVAPAPSASAPASASPAPSAQTVGGGGAGWQVQDVRYGDHTTFVRMVFDLAGGSGGPPSASVVNDTPQSLLVTLNGTQPASAPLPAPGGLVTKVSLVSPPPSPGATQYRVTLSRAASATAQLVTGPVRLVIDVS